MGIEKQMCDATHNEGYRRHICRMKDIGGTYVDICN